MRPFALGTLLLACTPADRDPALDSDDPIAPLSGPVGTRSLRVGARTNWVHTGVFLRAGEAASIEAAGLWSVDGVEVGPAGDPALGDERGCAVGSLAARVGLDFEGPLACVGEGGEVRAETDGVLYVGMIASTDLGETYGTRLVLAGALDVTVTSDADPVPTIPVDRLHEVDLDAVASGWVELASAHHLVVLPADQAATDRDTAPHALDTLDRAYALQADLRGAEPFFGQPVRWVADPSLVGVAYMLAGNPIRMDPDLVAGSDTQRILRAGEPGTDIWGFTHELGHLFTMPDGVWVYMIVNLESWPNVFTLHTLRALDSTRDQPHVDTYCAGRDAYLAAPDYTGRLRDDPFLQLCFLMDFEDAYGPGFYERFFRGMNGQTNEAVRYDGSDASAWRYVRDRFTLAAGEDTTPRFEAWGVPLE